MKNGFLATIAFFAVVLFGVNATAAPVESRFDLRLGGYVKMDAIHQDAQVGALRGALGTLGALPSAANEDRDQTNFTARQTRLNLTSTGPDFLGAKTRAFVEVDFYGLAGDATRGNVRMRHANFTLAWDRTEILFGQWWDIFGPFAASTLDFGTGANIGAPNSPRVAQIRVTQKFTDSLRLIVGLQDPLQDDLAGTFETESPAGNIAGQLVFTSKVLGASPGYWGLPMQPLTVSLFGQYGKSSEGQNVDHDAWGAGIFAHVPILKSSDGKSRAMTLTFEGQAYMAEGMSWNNANAHRILAPGEAAEGYGAIGQFIFYPTQPTGITAGYGRRGVVDSADYRAAGITGPKWNDGFFFNVAHDIGNVRLAAEYMRLEAKYFDSTQDADANRIQLSAMYFF